MEEWSVYRRARVYRLKVQEDGWDDKGTGFVSLSPINAQGEMGIRVRSDESETGVILQSKISAEHAYKRPQGSIIVWTEPSDGIESTISFQEAEGCMEIWNQLMEIQAKISKDILSAQSKVTSWTHKVTADGSSGFKAEAGRYHLYVGYSCPFAGRVLAVRALKGLEDVISVDVVHPTLGPEGWRFNPDFPKCTTDTINGYSYLSELYKANNSAEGCRYTVPVLYDKKEKKIVNNESAEIAVMLNSEFNEFAKRPDVDLYPKGLQPKIDELFSWIGDSINQGVYKCGRASSQEIYEKAFHELFAALERCEDILAKNRFLLGDTLTLADVRLFMTLIRFDAVYHDLFKTNKKRIVDYPNLWAYTREIYQMTPVKSIIDFAHIKVSYYTSHTFQSNKIVPVGPEIDYDAPVDRKLSHSTQAQFPKIE